MVVFEKTPDNFRQTRKVHSNAVTDLASLQRISRVNSFPISAGPCLAGFYSVRLIKSSKKARSASQSGSLSWSSVRFSLSKTGQFQTSANRIAVELCRDSATAR